MWAAVTPLSLPHTWNDTDGKSAYTTALGCTLSGIGTDYASAPKLKFDNTGDYMIIQVADAPGTITFNIKGNSLSGSYSFKIQESTNGSTYTDARDLTSVSSTASSESVSLNRNTRYIKLIYATKAVGNIGVGGISITKAAAPSIAYTVSFDAGENGSCSTTQLTESAAGAGVTLPACTPNEGFVFKGWAKTAAATTVDAGAAGTVFNPNEDCTLYAVYAKTHSYVFYVNGEEYMSDVAEEGMPLPSLAIPSDIYGRSFMGWTASAIDGVVEDKPSLVEPATTMGTTDLAYYAVFAKQIKSSTTLSYGWETPMPATLWESSNLSEGESYDTYKKSGNYAAATSGTTTAYIKTKNKIANPTLATCYYTKASSNTNTSSLFKIQVSTNGTSWTNVKDGKTMNNVSLGTFEVLTADLTEYSDVYVRFYYTGTTAIRVIDDVSVESGTIAISGYCTTVPDEETVRLVATDGELYYATFSSVSAFVVPNNLVVSVVDVDNGGLIVSDYDTDDVVAANTGVLLCGLEGGDYTISLTNATATEAPGTNLLRPASAPMEEEGFLFYKLAYGDVTDKSTLGFWWGAADGGAYTAKAGAYLAVPATTAASLVSGFSFGGNDETGVKAVEQNVVKDDGKYLKDGKIVIVRGGAEYDVMGMKK